MVDADSADVGLFLAQLSAALDPPGGPGLTGEFTHSLAQMYLITEFVFLQMCVCVAGQSWELSI